MCSSVSVVYASNTLQPRLSAARSRRGTEGRCKYVHSSSFDVSGEQNCGGEVVASCPIDDAALSAGEIKKNVSILMKDRNMLFVQRYSRNWAAASGRTIQCEAAGEMFRMILGLTFLKQRHRARRGKKVQVD